MLADYSHLDWSQGVRGKYFEPAMRAKRLVEIDPDVLAAFSSSADINAALRSVMQAASHVQAKRPSGKPITR